MKKLFYSTNLIPNIVSNCKEVIFKVEIIKYSKRTKLFELTWLNFTILNVLVFVL